MRAMDTRQVVASSSYQDELRKIEAAKSECKACDAWQFGDGLQCEEHGYEG